MDSFSYFFLFLFKWTHSAFFFSCSNLNVLWRLSIRRLSELFAELEMMKERFSKLLLGEDMSGSGKGACTSLAISNAITNLCGKFHFGAGFFLFISVFFLTRVFRVATDPTCDFSDKIPMCSYYIWTIVETRTAVSGEEINVAKRDGMACRC